MRCAAISCLTTIILLFTTSCGMIFRPINSGAQSSATTASQQTAMTKISASWAVLPLLDELESAYHEQHPNAVFQITAAESNMAHQSLLNNQVDMAFVFDQAAGPVYTGTIITKFAVRPPVIAYDALVVAASVNATVDGLTMAQLRDIYSGRVLTWDQVGGDNSRAEFVSRESGSASRELFDQVVMQGDAISTAAVVLPSDQAVKDYIISNPGVIGYFSMSYVDARVKIISLDSLLPDIETVKSGAYPLIRPIIGLVDTAAPLDAQRLLAFALSEKGCRIANKHYFCLR